MPVSLTIGSVVLFTSERFFDMKKQQCKEVIDAYRKFVTRQESVAKFLAEAEVGTWFARGVLS